MESEFPPFGWSHSRQKTLDDCARRYFYAYYAAGRGRRSGVGEEAWLASVLKRLTTFELVLGRAVHDRAKEILRAVRARRPRPGLDLLIERTRAALNRVYIASLDREAFLYATDRREMLLALYYDRGVCDERIAALREKMYQCLEHLHGCSLWAELEAVDPSEILAIDRICTFQVGGTLVYVAPDVIYRTALGGCVICDWKTGSCEGARDQLALYSLYARHGLGVSPRGGTYRGRVFGLSDGGSEEHTISDADLEAALERIRSGARGMRSYMVDPEQNLPRAKSAFPLTTRRTLCAGCSYFELCTPDLRLPIFPEVHGTP
ncbi:MAG: PD-(D/E)XK nuclease family protein [Gemmatimonadota bacterium]|nr:PD-(D/E)XK nuclease family protein [Gemmatimonadota bacterium]